MSLLLRRTFAWNLRNAALSLALALLLSGCTNSPYPPGQTSQNVVYKFLNFEPKTFDPSISFSVEEAEVIDLVYPSYFRYHYLKQSPFQQELSMGAALPEVAPFPYTETDASGKSVSRIGQIWTFKIRRDLRFQDDPCFPNGKGRPIVAKDFLYSFRRMADPAVDCPVLPWVQDKILGMEAYVAANQKRAETKQPADYVTPVRGLMEVPGDPYSFRIALNQPYPQLTYLMTMHFTTPLAREAVEKYGAELARHPVGSGPFLLEEYAPKQRIVLAVNPNRFTEYFPSDAEPQLASRGFLKDAGKRLPLSEKVFFSYLKEKTTQWNLFQQGYLDSVGVSKDALRQTLGSEGNLSAEMQARGIRIKRGAGLNCYYYVFRMTDPVVGGYTPEKRKLRQAISLAVDSDEYIRLFAPGQARKAEFLLPEGIYGYDPTFRNPYRDPTALERAKILLAEAGYPDGIDKKSGDRLTLYFDINEGGAGMRQTTGQLQKQLARLGIDLKVRAWRVPVYRSKLIKGDFMIGSYSWWADYPDPENFLFLFDGSNKSVNYAGYNNPEYNALFEKMKQMPNSPERLAIIKKMRSILVEDCPWVYNYHSEALLLDHAWLQNAIAHGVAYDGAKYQSIDTAARVRSQVAWNQKNWTPLWLLAIGLIASAIPAALTVRQRHGRSLRRAEMSEE